jgi:hypothetical protein
MKCIILACAVFLAFARTDHVVAQVAGTRDVGIVWEVKNRFRLFRNEADFLRQVDDPGQYLRAREGECELGTLAIGKWCQERISATGWAW